MDMIPTGAFLAKAFIMIDKYEIGFSNEVVMSNLMRLINQIWKLIPMRENNENWQKQLNNVIIETAGLNEIFVQDSHFLQLLANLEGLQVKEEISFESFRAKVFESINLLSGLKHELELIK